MAKDTANSVTTRSSSSANGNAKIPSALKVSFWDDMVKLEFCPELPESQKTETRRYDYDNTWITCITRVKCNELFEAYENVIVPAIKENRQDDVSIPIAGVNLLSINTGVDLYNDGEAHPYIELIKNVDPQTLKSSSSIMYEFVRGEYIHGYNKDTGTFGQRVLTNNELKVFMKDLNTFREASTKSYVHAARCVDKSYKDMISNSLKQIGSQVGADLSMNNTYNREGMGYGSIFDNKGGNNSMPAPQQQYGALDDLDALGDELS